MWFRGDGIQSGDPVIIANKNWNSGANPGWLLSANEGGENSFGTNFASSSTSRVDVEDIDYVSDEWWFLATVVQPGDITVYMLEIQMGSAGSHINTKNQRI